MDELGRGAMEFGYIAEGDGWGRRVVKEEECFVGVTEEEAVSIGAIGLGRAEI